VILKISDPEQLDALVEALESFRGKCSVRWRAFWAAQSLLEQLAEKSAKSKQPSRKKSARLGVYPRVGVS